MTELTKKVSRRTVLMLDNRITARNRDHITVTLYPDNTIGFRAHKSRKEVRLPLAAAYAMAIKSEADEVRKVKEQERRLKGLKPLRRKPIKSWLSLR
jgi:hypothetical protein